MGIFAAINRGLDSIIISGDLWENYETACNMFRKYSVEQLVTILTGNAIMSLCNCDGHEKAIHMLAVATRNNSDPKVKKAIIDSYNKYSSEIRESINYLSTYHKFRATFDTYLKPIIG